ncbi:MAG: hypothetical protein IJW44_01920, partial [Clostridia bacterium]|nr:hypothetical protein [Clostridia bacterium]
LPRVTNKYPPVIRGDFIFGHSPNTPGCAQVRFRLVSQPCNCYLPPVNGLRKETFLREEGGPLAVDFVCFFSSAIAFFGPRHYGGFLFYNLFPF